MRFVMKKTKSIICYRSFVSLFPVYISFDIQIDDGTKEDSQGLIRQRGNHGDKDHGGQVPHGDH